MSEAALVSIVVPCRNEAGHVEAFAASALAQVLPAGWRLEVIVADGESDDGTAQALAALAGADARVRVVANPGRIVSSGLNRAIGEAHGAVIVRMDVHTTYAADYVAQCIDALRTTGADTVGGPWRAEGEPNGAPMQAAIAAAFQSRWVAGGALSRRLDYDGWADTVYLGAWPRATFDRHGLFDEALVRNQDDEHNLRIVRGGGRIWQSSRIRSAYRPRASLAKVLRQYAQYGYWKPFVMKKHGQPAAWRQLVPSLFVVALVATGVVAVTGASPWPLVALLVAYAAVVLGMTVAVAAGRSEVGAVLGAATTLRVPAVIAAYHLAYGAGALVGWFDVVARRSGRARFARLTR